MSDALSDNSAANAQRVIDRAQGAVLTDINSAIDAANKEVSSILAPNATSGAAVTNVENSKTANTMNIGAVALIGVLLIVALVMR